ncbi:Gti1/Pac2 family-domain-containing protein [Amylostereum chailletii]|nr:Gti1/Pac2 family-domain-containing protein [Amylostereum chailletii]
MAHNASLHAHSGHTTHPALHIRDARDAHILLEAVRLNILPLITRRLTDNERHQLCSGNVFVWEEADFKGGLERWTDGRRWSQSRMRGDYLFYEEKIETTQEERDIKAARRARRALDPSSVPPLGSRRQDRPSKPDGLTKQTYSTQVYLPGSSTPRKWHIVAYFSGSDYSRLPVIDNYDYLRSLRVADGIFVSNKGAYKRTDPFPCEPDEDDSGYALSRRSSISTRAPSSSSSSSLSGSIVPTSPYVRSPPPSSAPTPQSPYATSLPRLSTIVPMHSGPGGNPTSHPPTPGVYPPHHYAPLSAEDRRILNSFPLNL